jgi:sugar phosphate isomerase/epimerase
MNRTPGTPIQGVTLYSFTRAFHGREYDLEGLIRRVASDGFGPGLEIVGFSSLRGFPNLDDGFVGRFRDLIAEVGLLPTSLSINGDIGLRRDRLMTQEELIEYITRQIEVAARLDFPIARVQISLTPDSMEQLLPVAERNNVTLALEVHAHLHGLHESILALRDRYEKLGSPYLGFTADWGATVSGFAPSLLEAYRRRGATDELLSAMSGLWDQTSREGPPNTDAAHGQRWGAFIALAHEHGRPDLGVDYAVNGTGLFGPAPVDTWLEIAPWIRHCHGKFFGIDQHGEEPSVPVRELIGLLVRVGYNGAVSSEYEGWHWNYWQSPFDIIRAEQVIQRSAAQDAGSRIITNVQEARGVLKSHLAAVNSPS